MPFGERSCGFALNGTRPGGFSRAVQALCDADGLTYSASGLPTGLSINSGTGLISGTIGNQAADGSPYTVTVSASDGHNTGIYTYEHLRKICPCKECNKGY